MKSIGIFALGLLLFVGCSTAQPAFDLNTKETKVIDGKKYSVPAGASTSSYAVESKVIKFYQSIGVSECKEGDITWEAQSVAEAVNSEMRTGSKGKGIEIYRKAASEGKVGCASPMQ